MHQIRYMFAILLDKNLEMNLRADYEKTFGKPSPVRTIHCTMIPPFTLNPTHTPAEIQALSHQTKPFTETFQFGPPGVFTLKSRQILYLAVNPVETLTAVYQDLFTSLQSRVTIGTGKFIDHKLPAFLPHVTLNYNFKGDYSALVCPTETFELQPPKLMIETGPGEWKPVFNTN